MARRQLSAIMFTDLAGYTAMMQEDEFNAKGLRDRHRKILEKEVIAHEGEILQYYGDGALSIFHSTILAAESAIAIQKASIEGKIPLRVGIHTGDIVIEEDGVFGDGVNIASRIESFSVPGSVMISEKAYDDIKNHVNFEPVLMGEFELKNVKKAIEVYALTNEGLTVPLRTDLKGKVKERIKSIAVLPFINRSPDPDNEYFSDGITEEIIIALAKVEGLRVISRTSSFSFKGQNVDVRDIGKKLEVQSILDGSVRKSGNKVRIAAQLSSTFDGYQLWSENYDRLLEDVFEVQDEIADKISQQLKAKLATNPKESSTEQKKVNVQAFNHYLQGLYHFNRWTPGDSEKAVSAYQQAIELDPHYDKAYSGLSQAYSLMSTTGYINPQEGYELSKEAALKALEINGKNEDAYIALSFVNFFYDWDFEKGNQNARRALEINPKSPEVNLALSLGHMIKGDLDTSIGFLLKAQEIDPLSTLVNRTLADGYYLKEDYKKAIELYDWLLEIDPNHLAAKEFKGWSLLMLQRYDEAIEIFESDQDRKVHALHPYAQIGYAYALKGDLEQAASFLSRLKKEAAQHPGKSYNFDFATIYSGMRQLDEAFKYLEIAMDERIGAVIFIEVSPIWKPIRSDQRFITLKKKIGLI